MASSTYNSWINAAQIISDTLDTAVIEMNNAGYIFDYYVDTRLGLVFADKITSPDQYLYGQSFVWAEKNGTFFIRKISSWQGANIPDTGYVSNGGYGYDFYDIQINGVLPIVSQSKARGNNRQTNFELIKYAGTQRLVSYAVEPFYITLFDIQGHRLFTGKSAFGGVFELQNACASGSCSNGPLIIRVRNSTSQGVFQTIYTK